MYAVIKTGGKQYKVASGDVVKLEKIAGEEGKEVIFNEVLALDDTVGTPLVSGASVKATADDDVARNNSLSAGLLQT